MTAVTFATPHLTLTAAHRNYVVARMKGLSAFAPNLRELELHVHPEGRGFSVEALMHRADGPQLAVHERGDCVEAALDRALHSCRRRLARAHERRVHARRNT